MMRDHALTGHGTDLTTKMGGSIIILSNYMSGSGVLVWFLK